ncbi:MAG: ATP-binding protein [Bacteroidia bacterium]|nr:ATP-binding protein [Bacteroidia bacterium]
MQGSPFVKGLPWLLAGILLLIVSASLFLFDADRTDAEIIADAGRTLQSEFDACVAYYSLPPAQRPPEPPEGCTACELAYAPNRHLVRWTSSSYLPSQRFIDRLPQVADTPVVRFENRHFYQIRRSSSDSVFVSLIPLYITYAVDNEFLPPFIFLGSWHDLLARKPFYLRSLRVSFGDQETDADFRIVGSEGHTLFMIDQVPPLPFRAGVRYAVLIFILLGGISLALFLRIYALHRWRYRYYINASLFFGIILLRLLLYWVNLPGEYIDLELFSPDILAFHQLAPSLGELTINIITLAALVGIAYMHLIRITNKLYRRLIAVPWLAWPAMALTLLLSTGLLRWYGNVFFTITENSQIDIEFANVFKADIYSFIILLDTGILLLSLTLAMMTMLKLNVLYARRFRVPGAFVALHALGLGLAVLFWFPEAPVQASMAAVFAAAAGLVVYRIPFKPLLHHDLINYTVLTACFSMLVTYHVTQGVNQSNRYEAERVARQAPGSQAANTVLSFNKSVDGLERDISLVKDRLERNPDLARFQAWLVDEYLRDNFKEFEVRLFGFDSLGNPLSGGTATTSYGPGAELRLEDLGTRVDPKEDLYQLPSPETKYLDLYVGRFSLKPGLGLVAEPMQFVLELTPNRREAEGLYPSLSMDQEVYDDIKLINSFDHAIYRNGVLYNARGQTPFPLRNEEFRSLTMPEHRSMPEYEEYVEPIGSDRLVVVRYPRQDAFNIVTTFSFIFYFFTLAALGMLVLPVFVFRTLRSRALNYTAPLRAKIRFGLLTISVLPMLVIIVLLYPFVSRRYAEDAIRELNVESARMADLLQLNYLPPASDRMARSAVYPALRERLRELAPTIRNDVNVFDESGRLLASTQPASMEMDIGTDLMNGEALEKLRSGIYSDLVVQEQLGELEYLSGYRPILGSNDQIVGFVNIPYVERQDALEDQVIDFLAYLANIYLIVFLLLNVVAVLVSGAVTKPLSMIQQRLAATRLGKANEPIRYESEDEIGAIVHAYNQMVQQLSESEDRLKQNQRELAWRQMARQVAHEIKNPLTPMKLSVQHLSRAWSEQAPRLDTMFPKVMKTLLSQIDSLARIANSFSEFAKMPDPVKSRVNLNEVLHEVIDLYSQSEEAIWLIDMPNEEFWTLADRDQLSRCFNNIIKNALQALDGSGIIHITMRILPDRARVEVKDNGKGMTPEVQARVFEPSFSTKTSGMGLGLAIVKRIVETTGGNISFQSKPEEGTTFFIEIPALDQAAGEPVRTEAAVGAGR